MTQKEFEERTKLKLAEADFATVHDIYMACGEDMDKDEFCALWKDGKYWDLLTRVTYEKNITEQAYSMSMNKIQNMQEQQKDKDMELAEFLIGKASAYEDTDFYKEAVRLIGQREVTLMKMRMDLPLWEEDKDFIKTVLENNDKGEKIAG